MPHLHKRGHTHTAVYRNPQMWTQNQYNIWHADYLAEKNQIKAQDVKAKFDLEKAQIGAIIRDWYYAKNPWLNG